MSFNTITTHGSGTLDYLTDALRQSFADKQMQVSSSPYRQFRQHLFDQARPKGWEILLVDLDEWVEGGDHGLSLLSKADRESLSQQIENDIVTLAQQVSQQQGRLIVASFRQALRPLMSYADLNDDQGLTFFTQKLNHRIAAALQKVPGALFWDWDGLEAAFGRQQARDDRMQMLGDIRFTKAFAEVMAQDLCDLIKAATEGPKKVLVLDLDDTLWGGLAAEDALTVKVGKEDPLSKSFWFFQQELCALKARGVLLALVSKNDEPVALKVMAEHPGMLLRPDDFICRRINWQDKASNIKSIAEELNLGLQAFAFWDDSPFEREWVQAALPEVTVATPPEDPAGYAAYLRAWPAFQTTQVTATDQSRHQQYVAEKERQAWSQQAHSLEDYLKGLATSVKIEACQETDIPRLEQLFMRTNQFNMTTRRRSAVDIQALMSSPQYECFSLRLEDRFGDQGLVGLAVVSLEENASQKIAQIEDFIMSCRVLGRDVEKAFMAFLINRAEQKQRALIRGLYAPTEKNDVAKNFYQDQGFQLIKQGIDGQEWERSDLKNPASPPWIKVEC